jgi:hypothetical protein
MSHNHRNGVLEELRKEDLPSNPTSTIRVAGTIPHVNEDPVVEQSTSDYPTPNALVDRTEHIWDDDKSAADNHQNLGLRLAAVGDLYRRPAYAAGLMMAPPETSINPEIIDTGNRLAAIIADRVRVRRMKRGNTNGSRIPVGELNTMLHTEVFLQHFRPVDTVVREPRYLPNFTLGRPGYNDGGRGQRFLFLGAAPRVLNSLDAIKKFLNVMAFASNADRTNTVGFALAVKLRNFWPGEKPVFIVTSTKSHAGKDTIVAFAAGGTPKVSVDYQRTDWAFRQGLVAALQACPDVGVVTVENACVEKGGTCIASATLDRVLTDKAPVLHSSNCRDGFKFPTDIVMAITTNFGTVSEDLMNRAVPIHLNPIGDVADRLSPIGNPKLEYLPANRELIDAELYGMVDTWIAKGRHLDPDVRHPFSDCARIIGGILKANDFTDFLGNYSLRRTADDPRRQALGHLGVGFSGAWKSADSWAQQAVRLGLVRQVILESDRDTDESRARGMGKVLSAHEDETFVVETDDATVTLRLKKSRRRFEDGMPSTRYCFEVVSE